MMHANRPQRTNSRNSRRHQQARLTAIPSTSPNPPRLIRAFAGWYLALAEHAETIRRGAGGLHSEPGKCFGEPQIAGTRANQNRQADKFNFKWIAATSHRVTLSILARIRLLVSVGPLDAMHGRLCQLDAGPNERFERAVDNAGLA